MALLKKIIMALFISVAMLATAPATMAVEVGQKVTLNDVIDLAEQTLAAMENGDDKEKILALLKETKQASKSIVISGPADLPRSKANGKIKKSRKAFRKDDTGKAIKLAAEAIEYYKKAKAKHFN